MAVKVTFDGPNKLINIITGSLEVSVQSDVYSGWKQWLTTGSNARFFAALRTVGGDPTVVPETLDATFFLINGWQMKAYPGAYQLVLDGNLFHDDLIPLFTDADSVSGSDNNIFITHKVSNIVRAVTIETGISGLTAAESSTLTSLETMVSKLEELYLVHGLDSGSALTVSPTARLSGQVTQSMSFDSGSGTTVVTRTP